jgi:hypothetical protein
MLAIGLLAAVVLGLLILVLWRRRGAPEDRNLRQTAGRIV